MEFVPEKCAHDTEGVSYDEGDDDERGGRFRVEGFDHINGIDHVGPENEIHQRLRPTKQNQRRPENVPATDQRTNYQTNLIRTRHGIIRYLLPLPRGLTTCAHETQ